MLPKKKLQADQVTDEQGRRRFHGAFTGGFSAGYYNSVGSAEGWKPKTFVSTRDNRADVRKQSTRDFMDDEDGLLGGILATKEEFDTFGKKTKEQLQKMAASVSHGSAVPGPVPSELIVPTSRPIGYQLLQKMGWKEGQGIGNRRRRPTAARRGELLSAVPAAALPLATSSPAGAEGLGVDLSSLPAGAVVDGEVVFAARDEAAEQMSRMPVPKADMYGLGFHPALHRPELSLVSGSSWLSRGRGGDIGAVGRGVYSMSDLVMTESSSMSGRGAVGSHRVRGDRDQGGFAIDDGEDDVYDYDPGPSVDEPLPPSGLRGRAFANEVVDEDGYGEAAGRQLIKDSSALPIQRCATDDRLPLEGFVLMSLAPALPDEAGAQMRGQNKGNVSSSTDFLKTFYPPPQVPAHFREWHTFASPKGVEAAAVSLSNTPRSVVPARANLSEPVPPGEGSGCTGRGAVYEMLDAKGREQLDRALGRVKVKVEAGNGSGAGGGSGRDAAATATTCKGKLSDRDSAVQPVPSRSNAMAQGLAAALKGRFAPSSAGTVGAAPEKAVDSTTANASEAMVLRPGMVTAQELKARRAALEAAECTNTSQGASSTCPGGSRGLVGRSLPTGRTIARVTAIWVPNRLLCKRMNVPMPDVSLQLPTGTGEVLASGREEELYQKHIGAYASLASPGVAPTPVVPGRNDKARVQPLDGSNSNRTVTGTSVVIGGIEDFPQDLPVPTAPRPPLSLFKSIFEADSSSDSDSDSDSGSNSDSECNGSDRDAGAVSRDNDTGNMVMSHGASGGEEGLRDVGVTASLMAIGAVTAEHKYSDDNGCDSFNSGDHSRSAAEMVKRKYTAAVTAEGDNYAPSRAPALRESGREPEDMGGEDQSTKPPRILFRKPTTAAGATVPLETSIDGGVAHIGSRHQRQRERRLPKSRSAGTVDRSAAARRSFEYDDDVDSDGSGQLGQQGREDARKRDGNDRSASKRLRKSSPDPAPAILTPNDVSGEVAHDLSGEVLENRSDGIQFSSMSSSHHRHHADVGRNSHCSGTATPAIQKLKKLMQSSSAADVEINSAENDSSESDSSSRQGKSKRSSKKMDSKKKHNRREKKSKKKHRKDSDKSRKESHRTTSRHNEYSRGGDMR